MELTVIIPALNEEKLIGNTLNQTITFLKEKKINYEIIVVDDGSTDGTRAVVRDFVTKGVSLTPLRKNKGKGYSVRQGMLLAKKQYALFMDADNSTPISEVEEFLKLIKEHDVVIASRNLKESVIAIKQPWLRSMLGNIFPLLVRLLVVRGIKDTQCGFKLFSRKAITEIFTRARLNRWGFDVELLFIARKKKLSIKELPITWKNEGASKVSAFKDSIDMFLDLLRIRIHSLKGRYK